MHLMDGWDEREQRVKAITIAMLMGSVLTKIQHPGDYYLSK